MTIFNNQCTMTLTFDLLTPKSIVQILDSWGVCMWSFMKTARWKGKQSCIQDRWNSRTVNICEVCHLSGDETKTGNWRRICRYVNGPIFPYFIKCKHTIVFIFLTHLIQHVQYLWNIVPSTLIWLHSLVSKLKWNTLSNGLWCSSSPPAIITPFLQKVALWVCRLPGFTSDDGVTLEEW